MAKNFLSIVCTGDSSLESVLGTSLELNVAFDSESNFTRSDAWDVFRKGEGEEEGEEEDRDEDEDGGEEKEEEDSRSLAAVANVARAKVAKAKIRDLAVLMACVLNCKSEMKMKMNFCLKRERGREGAVVTEVIFNWVMVDRWAVHGS